VLRPQIRWTEDKSTLDWPETMVYVAQPAAAARDVIFLLGNEPHFHWSTFVDQTLAYLTKLQVKTMVTARCFPASVPHTRPAPVCLTVPARDLLTRFKAQRPDWKIEGEADISMVLSARAEDLGWQVLDLSVLQPSYFPRMPNAEARLALIESI